MHDLDAAVTRCAAALGALNVALEDLGRAEAVVTRAQGELSAARRQVREAVVGYEPTDTYDANTGSGDYK